ncbi:OmpW/AlkL family protein [Thalassotalea sp. PLHSN55]|uniref:OmpW/AlkL family protein n=1 Tax=Thalassotalea sp. PLHSN55 TaxID=3435888 RepID=UPI003F8425AC
MKKLLLATVGLFPLLFSAIASAEPHHPGDMIFRAGISSVAVKSGHSDIYVDDSSLVNTLSPENGEQVSLSYIYFIDRSWALEFLTATPSKHELMLNGESGTNLHIAEASQIPLSFSVLYYPDKAWDFKPYIGAGFNYSFFVSEKFTAAASDLNYENLDFDNALDFSFQVGADYQISKQWSVNFSARWIGLNSKGTFVKDNGAAADDDGFTKIDFNPLVFSLMVGYQF